MLFNAAALLLGSATVAAAAAVDKIGRFKYYNMPTSFSGPCDLSTGPDGNIWVSDFLAPKVARINPKTGAIKEYTIPYRAPIVNISIPGPVGELVNRATLGCVSQPGEDGNMYFASGIRNQFAKLNMKTKKFKVFTFNNPVGNLQPLNDMWRGPTGMYITQTTANKISVFDYKTEKITDHRLPTPVSGPVGLYLASDGCMWFCEFFANKMGRFNFTSGEIKDWAVPGLLTNGPAVTRAETKDKQGRRWVWATGFLGNSLVGIDIDRQVFKVVKLPQLASFPVENTFDKKGNVWYSTATYSTINRYNPDTGKITNIPTPNIVSEPGIPPTVDIAMHFGAENDMWFTELAQNRVGRYDLHQ